MSIADTTKDQPAASSENVARTLARWLLPLGVALAVLVIVAFVAQVNWARLLITPWYLPIGGTLAAVMVLLAGALRRSWWRAGLGIVLVALASLEWYFLLGLTVLPRYAGPVAEGNPIPAFHAELADGTAIDESYFKQGRPTALVFFQGRWCPFCMTQLKDLDEHRAEFERVGANVVVVSIENLDDAASTKRDFPSLTVVSDERRELSNAIDLINKNFAPDGGDAAAPTILLVDGQGVVRWLHRPTRFIARPSAVELAARIEKQ